MSDPDGGSGNNGWRHWLMAGGVLSVMLLAFYFSFLTGRTHLWDDLLFVHYPGMSYLVTALQEGRFPLWLSGLRDGIPFYTDFGMQAFYFLSWPLAFFVKEGQLSAVAYQWYLVLQFLLAGIFIFIFLQENRLQFWASVAGMVVFVFSAFFTLHIIHAGAVSALLWLPAELYFARKIVARSRWMLNSVLLIACILMSFFAGFPQVVMYSAYFLGAYWLFLVWMRLGEGGSGLWRCWSLLLEVGKIGSVFMVALLLGAMLFVPAAENWSLSHRQQLGFREISDLSLPWYYLIHGLVPNFFGATSGDGSGIPFWGYNKDTLEFKSWHAGAWMFWEFGFYAGQLALISIAVLAFNFRKLWCERRELAFFLLTLVPILLLMLGRYGGLFNVFYHIAPGFSMFRTPARIGCLVDVLAAISVAVVLDALWRGRLGLKLRGALVTLGIVYVGLFIWVVGYGVNVFPELKDDRLMDHALRQIGLSVAFFTATAGLLVWLKRQAEQRSVKTATGEAANGAKITLVFLTLLVFWDLYLAFHQFHPGRTKPQDYYADRNGIISQLVSLREQQGPFRFAQMRDGTISEEVTFPRNTGYLYPGYEALEGYILFFLKDITAFSGITNERVRLDIQNVGVIANVDSRTRQVGLMRYTNSLPRAKFYHEMRLYEDAKSIYADLGAARLDYRRIVGVLSNDYVKCGTVLSAAGGAAEAEVHFLPKTPEEYQISYRTTAPGIIFVSESFYPGWEADGGKYPIIRTFGAFKGIVIPAAGSGVITVKFSPRSFKIGLAISLGTLVMLAATYIWLARRERKRICGQ